MATRVKSRPVHRPVTGERRAGVSRVLVGTDLSLDGDRAVRRVATLALAPRATVIVAHVLPGKIDPATDTIVRGAADAALAAEAAKLAHTLSERRRDDVTVTTALRRGNPAQELLRLAATHDVDLVCVGRRGQSRVKELLMGTTARRLVRRGRQPVLVVGPPPESPYRRALVGSDLSLEAHRAAKLMRRIVPPTARLAAVYAYEDPFAGVPPALVPADRRARRLEAGQAIRDRARAVRRLMTPLGIDGLILKHGDPRSVLLDAARAKQADLLAVGSAGKSRLGRVLVGSVAEWVVERAPCDVLVTRRRGMAF